MNDHYTAHAELDRADGFYKIGETAAEVPEFIPCAEIYGMRSRWESACLRIETILF